MNLHQILSRYSFDQLQQLADETGIVTLSPSTRNLLQCIREKYRDDAFVAEVLAEAPGQSVGFLQSLLYLVNPGPEPFDVLEEFERAWQGGDGTPVIEPLLNKGLLFKNPGEGGEYILPAELNRLYRRLLRPKPFAGGPPAAEFPSGKHSRTEALESQFHLLSILSKHKAPITQKGAPHRKLFELFAKRYPDAQSDEWTFDFTVEFCGLSGLLHEQNGHLRATAKADAWFDRPDREILREAWRSYFEHYVIPSPLQQGLLVLVMGQCAHNHEKNLDLRFDYHDFAEGVAERFRHALNPPEAMDWIAKFIKTLCYFGLARLDREDAPAAIEIPQDAQGFWLGLEGIESAPDGEVSQADPCMMQPNFDILVPPTRGYRLLWRMEQAAEFARRDVMTRYHITQHSVMNAMRKGWEKGDVLGFFEEAAGGRIPGNVHYSLREWCEKYGEITLRRVVLVECRDEALANELTCIPEINRLLGVRLSERHFAVNEADMKSLSRAMRERGYEPASPKAPPQER